MTGPPLPSFTVIDTKAALEEERKALNLEDGEQPTALCLSGGGIRSAAFCLGVLQALARRALLGEFRYLSTVSGGGYIGAWLTRCIAAKDSKIAAVERDVLAHAGAPEPAELKRLRRYTNYLTPRSGLASDDTWAGIMLWLRNTLVNWAVFLPLMLAVAAIPGVYAAAVCALQPGGAAARTIACVLGLLGLSCLGLAVLRTCVALPSHQFPDLKAGAEDQQGLAGAVIFKRIIVLALAWAFLVPLALSPWLALLQPVGPAEAAFWTPLCAGPFWFCAGVPASLWTLTALPVGTIVVCLAAYGTASATQLRPDPHRNVYWDKVIILAARCAVFLADFPGLGASVAQPRNNARSRVFRANFRYWAASCVVSAAVLTLGAWLGRNGPVLLVVRVGRRTLLPRGAFADIAYPADGDRKKYGKLLYIKPWLPGGAPVELTAFRQVKPSFPHETTANQFFTESDFESYRQLGAYLTRAILDQSGAIPASSGALTLDGLFTALGRLATAPHPGGGPPRAQQPGRQSPVRPIPRRSRE